MASPKEANTPKSNEPGLQAETRKLIYYHSQGDPGIYLSELAEAGWETRTTCDLDELSALVQSGNSRVGLLNLAGCANLEDVQRLESLFEPNDIIWTALLPEQLENNPAVWKLIYDYCFDYHKLPAEPGHLLNTLRHAFGMARLKENLSLLESRAALTNGSIIGECGLMRFLKQKVAKIAAVDAPVLILGESGTGKELVARALHSESDRAGHSFEAVNCAALPATLIQSELFGYEKGAFTGANKRKKGLFELANGGTVFLDEIGDLPLELQVILLRVLEEGKLRRLGGTEDIRIDVRVIAATHVDLAQAVEAGRFREDLYYRLNVLDLNLPPLRDRGEDIDLLANHFLKIYGEKSCTTALKFGRQAQQVLRCYDWPGNVRELINRIQRAVVMGEGALIKPLDLGLERRKSHRGRNTLKGARQKAEREAIIQALHRTGNQVAEAARELEISRVTVYRLIEKYGIEI